MKLLQLIVLSCFLTVIAFAETNSEKLGRVFSSQPEGTVVEPSVNLHNDVILLPASPVSSGEPVSNQRVVVEQKKKFLDPIDKKHIFGVGFMLMGPYGIGGLELDFRMGTRSTLGLGVGTGHLYHTWHLYGRHFMFSNGPIQSFVQLGYTNWRSRDKLIGNTNSFPEFLTKEFLTDGNRNFTGKENGHMIYPAIGVNYEHHLGINIYGIIQYLIRVDELRARPNVGLGVMYYF